MFDLYYYIFNFIVGIFVGSFLGVLIYRLPREISILKPRSLCSACSEKIPFYRNIPLFSYLIQKGRCFKCNEKIDKQVFYVELLTGFLFVYNFIFFKENTFYLYKGYFLIMLCLPIFFIDFEHKIIPDSLNIIGIIGGFVFALTNPHISILLGLKNAFFGFIVAGGLFFIVSEVYYRLTKKEGLGGGDIKLMFAVGALFGWYKSFLIVFISSFIGAIFGIILIVFMKRSKSSGIAFGPFIVIAILLMYFGEEWIFEFLYR